MQLARSLVLVAVIPWLMPLPGGPPDDSPTHTGRATRAYSAMPWQMPLPPAARPAPEPPKPPPVAKARDPHIIGAYREDRQRVLEVTFRTREAHEKRLITSQVVTEMPSNATDDLLMVNAGIACGGLGANAATHGGVNAIQNILRGKTLALHPQFIFQARKPGQYRCNLTVGSMRPRPATTGAKSATNVFRIRPGSSLKVSGPLPKASAQAYHPTAKSVRLDGTTGYTASSLAWKAPKGVKSFRVAAAVKLTACTARGGSTDPVTGDVLCAGVDYGLGVTVRSDLVVTQLARTGSRACATTRLPFDGDGLIYTGRDTHHRMIYASGIIRVSSASKCGPRFAVKSIVQRLRGTPVVVHRQGTITTLVPR